MFRRRMSNFKRPYTKRRYAPKLASAQSIKYVEREVAKLASDIEVKHSDIFLNAAFSPITASSIPLGGTSLTCLAKGATESTNLGAEVSWKTFDMTYKIFPGWNLPNVDPYPSKTRVIVVWHKQWSKGPTAPGIDMYLDIYGVSPSGDLLSYGNWSNRKQFKVLYDKTHLLMDKGCPTMSVIQSVHIPLEGHKSVYDTNAVASLTNLETGALFLYVLTDAADTNTQSTVADVAVRLTYTDA